MGREIDLREQFVVDATPEQVWAAIATGPGIDSWFMGRNEVQPGAGGTVRTSFGGYEPESTVTAWEPLARLAYGSDPAEDGRFIAYEFLIEGREGGSTVLRAVTSGFLPGDDWEAEYDAMTKGFQLFFRTLGQYLAHFAGRRATPITAFGPPVSDWPQAWTALAAALGRPGAIAEGDRVRFVPPALPPVAGVVYFVNPDTVGVRADDALYRFIKGFQGGMVASHHLFADTDQPQSEQAWGRWLAETFANPTGETS
jgi:uncharacterized protein YndB with AHSA1/START domain